MVKGIKEWLWIFAHTDFALFHAAGTRSGSELELILGASYTGVLSSDDYSVYNGYSVRAQQKCLAHLRRHFKKLSKLPGLHNQEIGVKFIDWSDEGFHNYAFYQKTQKIDEFWHWASLFKLKIESALLTGFERAGSPASKLLRSLLHKADQWWYFLNHPEMPPDNNLAERTLRESRYKKKS